MRIGTIPPNPPFITSFIWIVKVDERFFYLDRMPRWRNSNRGKTDNGDTFGQAAPKGMYAYIVNFEEHSFYYLLAAFKDG